MIENKSGLVRTSFTELTDLANEQVGGKALACSDDFFAPKERLLQAAAPVWIEGRYDDHGKWMDGWESRRKRVPGHDWCLVQLGVPGVIRGAVIDTAWFTGNYPEYASLEAASCPDGNWEKATWTEILPKSALAGSAKNLFPIMSGETWTHLRLNSYPDGGIARLRVHGEVRPDWKKLKTQGLIDIAAIQNGGRAITANDVHYGNPESLTYPNRARVMGEGWETRRRRGPGNDWAILKLATKGKIQKVEVDTHHYKGNYPDTCSIEVATVPDGADLLPCDFRDNHDIVWKTLLPKTKLQPDHRHDFEKELSSEGKGTAVNLLRLQIYPDGGVSRLRVWAEVN